MSKLAIYRINTAIRPGRPRRKFNVTNREVQDWELAYMAGIVDGEGCLYINPHTWSVGITISMKDKLPLQLFQDVFGGDIKSRPRRSTRTPNWRHLWSWSMGGRRATWLIDLLIPFLRNKKSQAELALRFQLGLRPTSSGARKGIWGVQKLTEEELEARKVMWREMRRLKHIAVDYV